MKIKGIILLTSLVTALVLTSGGYGYWQKELTIEGDITVVKPDPIIIVPLIGQPVPADTNVQPGDNTIGEDLNSKENQTEERLSNAPASIETNVQAPEQLGEQGDKTSDQVEPTEQVEDSEQSEKTTEEQAPSNDDNESSKNVESAQSGDQETMSQLQDNVEDGE